MACSVTLKHLIELIIKIISKQTKVQFLILQQAS